MNKIIQALVAGGQIGKKGLDAGLGLGRKAGQRIVNNLGPIGKTELAYMLGPDVLFGGVAAAMTPGDLGDKAIAGVGSAVGGAAGGLGLRGLIGPKSGLGILGAEMIGGISGDMVGQMGSDSLIRMKGGGTTPWEKQQLADQSIYEDELRKKLLAEILAGQRG